MSDNSFVLLMEAIMEQAYKDLESNNEEIRKDAEQYVSEMKEMFA